MNSVEAREENNLTAQALQIGDKLRELRLEKRLLLRDLSDRVGISKSYLSNIENNRLVPPIPALIKLARVLGVPLDHFFQNDGLNPKFSITRGDEQIRIERKPHYKRGQVSYVLIPLEAKKSLKAMEPYLIELSPFQATELVLNSNGGEQFMYVLKGKVEFSATGITEILEPGDVIYFNAASPHSFRGISIYPAQIIAVSYHHRKFGTQ